MSIFFSCSRSFTSDSEPWTSLSTFSTAAQRVLPSCSSLFVSYSAIRVVWCCWDEVSVQVGTSAAVSGASAGPGLSAAAPPSSFPCSWTSNRRWAGTTRLDTRWRSALITEGLFGHSTVSSASLVITDTRPGSRVFVDLTRALDSLFMFFYWTGLLWVFTKLNANFFKFKTSSYHIEEFEFLTWTVAPLSLLVHHRSIYWKLATS